LSKRITQMCTVTGPDTMAVLESMLEIIPEELAEGNIVEPGDFGSFSRRPFRPGGLSARTGTPGRCGCAATRWRWTK